MFRKGSVAWQVALDFPKELQFLGYIAQREHFRVPETAPPASEVEAQWQAWWQQLPAQTFGIVARDVRRDFPNLDSQDSLRVVADRHRTVYDPPDFLTLQEKPALRDLCLRYWPVYHAEWETVGGAGVKQIMDWHERLHPLRIDRIVQQCEKATGKPVYAFSLTIDFLLCPEDYYRSLSNTHFLLGRSYLEQDERVKTLLQTTITQLLLEHNG